MKKHLRSLLFAGLAVGGALSLAFAQDGAAEMPDGAEQYQLWCAACHMSDGRGAEGAGRYPNLAGNPAVEVSADLILLRILNGYGAMPSFASRSNEQIAAIVNFVRNELNDADADISPEDVEARR